MMPLLMNVFWGVLVPASILLISVILTFWLYRLFSQAPPPPEARPDSGGTDGTRSNGGRREANSSP